MFPKAEKSGTIPDQSTWTLDPNASYFYYCANETVDGNSLKVCFLWIFIILSTGVEFPYIPETNEVPLVTDMSSSIMTKKLDISKVHILKFIFVIKIHVGLKTYSLGKNKKKSSYKHEFDMRSKMWIVQRK